MKITCSKYEREILIEALSKSQPECIFLYKPEVRCRLAVSNYDIEEEENDFKDYKDCEDCLRKNLIFNIEGEF